MLCHRLALKWAANWRRHSVTWSNPSVAMAVRGALNATRTNAASLKDERFRLTTPVVQALVQYLDAMQPGEEEQVALLLAFEALLRVQSECIPLQCGGVGEDEHLPAGRHSAVLWTADKSIVVRLASRKNRPRGSVLKRRCRCPAVGAHFCPACRTLSLASTKKLTVGDRLFDRTASQMAGCIRAALRILGVEHKAGFTWKAARSGRATELAAQGMPLAQIMDLGEWKSSAIFNYIDESAVDAAEMRRLADLEDDEDDAVA